MRSILFSDEERVDINAFRISRSQFDSILIDLSLNTSLSERTPLPKIAK